MGVIYIYVGGGIIMAELQQTLIYIEKENYEEADFMSRSFVTREIKNRAYLNVLGAEVVMKYLASEGIDVESVYNLHSISKILENYDIADILLPNIHIDVRVVFNKKQIFIPKSHFENEIVPDVYAFLVISEDYKTAEFLGYCQPSAINKRKSNSDYYFVELEQLANANNFAQFVKDYVGKVHHNITEEEMLRGRQLSVSLADHNISKFEEKELVELLLQSSELRESVLEFDNFETLAYSAAPEMAKYINEDSSAPVAGVVAESGEEISEDESLEISEDDIIEPTEDSLTEESLVEETLEEDETQEELLEETPEELAPVDALGEDMLGDGIGAEELPAADIEEQSLANDTEESVEVEEPVIAENDVKEPEISMNEVEISPIEEPVIDSNLSVDAILDQTIAAIDAPVDNGSIDKEESDTEDKKDDSNIGKTVSKVVETATGVAAAATGAAAIAGAATAAAASTTEAVAGAAASEGAMKLAGVSGEIIDDVVNTNISKQSENLDKIDFEKVGTNPEAIEMSEVAENIDIVSKSKLEENLKNEQSGEYDAPKDLDKLNKVDTIASEKKEQTFVQETVDMLEMETVENDLYREEVDSGVDIDTLTDLEAVMKKEEELTEAHILSESEVVNLPETADFTISEDGTSSFDDMFSEENYPPKEDTENLVDIKPLDDDNFVGDLNLDSVPEDTITESAIEDMDLSPIGDMQEVVDEEKNVSEDSSIPNLEADDNIDISPIDIEDTIAPLDQNIELPEESILPVESENISEESPLDSLSEDSDIDLSVVEKRIDRLAEAELEGNSVEQEEVLDIEAAGVGEDALVSEDILSEPLDEASSSVSEDEISENVELPAEPVSDMSSEMGDTKEVEAGTENVPAQEDDFPAELFESAETVDENDNANKAADEASLDDFLDAVQEVSLEDQDWLNAETTSEDDVITEPETPVAATVVNAVENTVSISDKTFKPGEIPIDINNVAPVELDGPESLGDLYNHESPLPGGALLNNPGRMSNNGNSQKKSPMAAVLGFVGFLVVLVIIGAVGFGVAKMFKAPKEETPQPITDETLPMETPDTTAAVSEQTSLDVNPNNVVSMDNNTNALASTAGTNAAATAARTTGTATTFTEIKKMSWSAPDYVSSQPSFKQFFQSSGKSLKNALTVDLLEAKDFIYSDQVRISVTFEKDGTFKNSQIETSSGSTQIDSIVLQTVNQTLKSLKAPHSVGNDESTTAILKIYF